MCEHPHHDNCHQVNNIAKLSTKEDLIKYKEYLEGELEIVKKAIQDIEEEKSM